MMAGEEQDNSFNEDEESYLGNQKVSLDIITER
jgi:hypothetical protein